MNEIKCPKCGTVFQISETDYESIVKQIRDKEFETEIKRREEEYKRDKESAIKIAESNLEKKLKDEINNKELEINDLKNEIKTKEEQTKNKLEKEYSDNIHKKTLEIEDLKHQLELKENEKELEIKKTTSAKDEEIIKLNNELKLAQKEHELNEKNLKEKYNIELKQKDEEILLYKDYKARLSTKMIGESLEQHCNAEFNKLRPLFPNAYFEKDNDAKSGSKGDFIFRDFDDDKVEYVSIMFEMKNEADDTAKKHKNEDFFKELDKDRNEKNCEYAVLVSLLESENELYNSGIVDVSHKYPKMYVIRPQFFIPLITLLRNVSTNSLMYKKELQILKDQNIDILKFEEKLNIFKEQFGRNYRIASDRFGKAINDIDKTIKSLENIKGELLTCEKNYRLANEKAEKLTINKLTKDSPTLAQNYEEAKEKAGV